MSNICNLCGSEGLVYSESFWGADNVAINVATCSCCQSFIPEYIVGSEPEVSATLQQVKFHEDWWDESSKDELDEVLSNVKNLVGDLQTYLGSNDPDNLVIELGSGRGSLLRALLDEGYNAYGCEPAPKLVALARQHYGLAQDRLFEIPGGQFLDHVVPALTGHVQAIVLWHVLEHLENPMQLVGKLYEMLREGGCLILQLPMFCKQYVYPEHYFFPSQATFEYMAKSVGFQVEAVDYDLNNFFVTVCFRKSTLSVLSKTNELIEKMSNMTAFAQAVFLRDEVIQEREKAVAAQAQIINSNIQGMKLMESLIFERDQTVHAQTKIIDEKVLGMNVMTTMIDEREKNLEVASAVVISQEAEISSMESVIKDMTLTIENTREELDGYKKSFLFKAAKLIRLIK
ncbi:class I SAM-dependent methyltransferase [Pseudomonas putida]|mgnify:CR=1 FL=1|uniref:class I SAM-dependent methyltransferase n=1 Tax=Pseudomonas putida TaxID=303 RepID=UPI001CD77207|nr:class I SAM-dependent methyltransferase [Pseudomonas putida]